MRHAFADVGGNANRARAWARAARRWPTGAQPDLLDAYRLIDVPTLLLWADEDRLHPVEIAEEALDLLPDAQLRVLPGTGFLMAYDDPVGWRASSRRSAPEPHRAAGRSGPRRAAAAAKSGPSSRSRRCSARSIPQDGPPAVTTSPSSTTRASITSAPCSRRSA